MAWFKRKTKSVTKPEMKGYNEEKLRKMSFMPEEVTKKINDEIDRVFDEKPMKLDIPTFEEFCKRMESKEPFKLG